MMDTEQFFQKIRSYTQLSAEAEQAWLALLKEKTYRRGENFISTGKVPKNVAFVTKGLFSQYYITDNGDMVIKYFFPEGAVAGSIARLMLKTIPISNMSGMKTPEEPSSLIPLMYYRFNLNNIRLQWFNKPNVFKKAISNSSNC